MDPGSYEGGQTGCRAATSSGFTPQRRLQSWSGSRELAVPGEANYIEVSDSCFVIPAFRAEMGKAMRERFRAEFRPERSETDTSNFLLGFSARMREDVQPELVSAMAVTEVRRPLGDISKLDNRNRRSGLSRSGIISLTIQIRVTGWRSLSS